jgi:hypothetical protein
MISLPERIFFTGIPGSGWSVICQEIESLPGFNISDRTPERCYDHVSKARHRGAYFGSGMEFPASLDITNIDAPWKINTGTRIVKSHEWATQLNDIKEHYPSDWIFLIYAEAEPSLERWIGAGGFNIKYPKYDYFKDAATMLKFMLEQNKAILEFAQAQNIPWCHYDREWVSSTFEHNANHIQNTNSEILVALIK